MFLVLHFALSPSPRCYGYYIDSIILVWSLAVLQGKLLPSSGFFGYCMGIYCPFLGALGTIIHIHRCSGYYMGDPLLSSLGTQHRPTDALGTVWQSIGDFITAKRSADFFLVTAVESIALFWMLCLSKEVYRHLLDLLLISGTRRYCMRRNCPLLGAFNTTWQYTTLFWLLWVLPGSYCLLLDTWLLHGLLLLPWESFRYCMRTNSHHLAAGWTLSVLDTAWKL